MIRTVVTLHLPMSMEKAARLLKAVQREYPGAVVKQALEGWAIQAEADEHLQARPAGPSEGDLDEQGNAMADGELWKRRARG